MNLAEKSSVVIPPPDYLECASTRAAADKRAEISQNTSTFKAPVSRPEALPPVSKAAGPHPVCLTHSHPKSGLFSPRQLWSATSGKVVSLQGVSAQ